MLESRGSYPMPGKVSAGGPVAVRGPAWPPGGALILVLSPWLIDAAHASQFDVAGPSGSVAFGAKVLALPNGNIVVTDPDATVSGHANAGAVYLYGPGGGSPISTLTGAQADDRVGSGGTIVVGSGNFLALSPEWDNGAAAGAGAVTWGSATAGVSGVVSQANSLVGSSTDDAVGSVGLFTETESITVLSNGNYVVRSPNWHNADGAATWGDGNAGAKGTLSMANSLVGTQGDRIASIGVTALTNGNYVVSGGFSDFTNVGLGAATWGNGTTGVKGTISESNSLVGVTTTDAVGLGGVVALSNGNYVVASPQWDYPSNPNAGAATWGNGSVGTTGRVLPGNSLIGENAGGRVGNKVIALANGNYVVLSPDWPRLSPDYAMQAGAATWGNGATGTTGVVDATNSLTGSVTSDRVGYNATALSNGNYVVGSPYWNNAGKASAGAATWCNGNGATVSTVSIGNSLVGGLAADAVGTFMVAMTNGSYVVVSPGHDFGAATWESGDADATGEVSSSNSLVGSSVGDYIVNVTALSNGNFVVNRPFWTNSVAGITGVGAATWGSGIAGIAGAVSGMNSLVGTTAADHVGMVVTALTNGHYVVASESWDFVGTAADAGAATWGRGTTGLAGEVSFNNSLAGAFINDKVGIYVGATAMANGNYVVRSAFFDNMSFNYVGAVALVRGYGPTGKTVIEAMENVHGGFNPGFVSYSYDKVRDQLVVGRPAINKVTVLKLDLLFRDDFSL